MPAVLKCPKCDIGLADLNAVGGVTVLCPRCLKEVEVMAFPALFRAARPSQVISGEAAAEGESTCFYHPQKKAVLPCDGCGRFLCALCDIEFSGQHLCSTCLETGARKKNIQNLEKSRRLGGRQAFALGVIPVFLTGPIAVAMAIKYWNAPGSLVAPKKWYTRAALVLGGIQTVILVLLIIALFSQ